MHVELRVANRKANVKRVKINESAVIGRRSSCDVRIVSDEVSREHCRIDVSDVGATITDLGSTNGTFVNGEQLNGVRVAPLNDGDELTIGPAKFRIAFIGMGIDPDPTEKAIDGKVIIAEETVHDDADVALIEQTESPDLQLSEESIVSDDESDTSKGDQSAPETTSLKNDDTEANAVHDNFFLTDDSEQTAEGESALNCDFGSEDQGVLDALDESGEMEFDISDHDEHPDESAEPELDLDNATTRAVNREDDLDFSEDEIVDILGTDDEGEFNSGIVAGVHSDADMEIDSDDDQLSDFIKGL